METIGTLNPHAPPFYPKSYNLRSAYHVHPTYITSKTLTQPEPAPATRVDSRGPRNRKNRVRGRASVDGDGRSSRMWKRSGFYQEIMPLDPSENSTSVMIRNIPNNYTRELLVEFLDNHCKHENEKGNDGVWSAFDFLYLPIDFKYHLNAGFAFVNFTTSEAAWKFHESIKGRRWALFQSQKIADVTRAKIQGKEALVRNFERMNLCSPSSDYLPVCFDPPRDGSTSSSSSTTIGNVRRS